MANYSTPYGNGSTNNSTRNGFGSGASFNPSFGVNVNVNKGGSGGANGFGAAANPGVGLDRSSALALPEPAFYSAADVRSYCEALRAFTVYASIEVAVAAEILKATLEQAPAGPGAHLFEQRMKARTVGRKMFRAAEALADAAKDAAAVWAAFQREYADVMTPQPRPQARPFQF